MQEVLSILRKGYNYDQYVHPGPTIVSNVKDADLTHTAWNSGWKEINNVDRVPQGGMSVEMNFPQQISATGAGTTGTTLSANLTFSDDGVSAVAGLSLTFANIALTFNGAGVLTAITINGKVVSDRTSFLAYFRMPEIRHKFARLTLTTSLGASITAVAYGPVGAALVINPDTEASNSYDIS